MVAALLLGVVHNMCRPPTPAALFQNQLDEAYSSCQLHAGPNLDRVCIQGLVVSVHRERAEMLGVRWSQNKHQVVGCGLPSTLP